MAGYSPGDVVVGPGTLYAAPLGTTEPTALTGAWPSGWVPLGYTDSGSTFAAAPQTAALEVEEELDPIKVVTTGRTITQVFSLAQQTAQLLLLAINAGVGVGGVGTGLVANTTGVNAGDGSIWVEPPVLGTEVRVMLGWDSLPEAATGTNAVTFGRLILRQCFQTGTITQTRQKGNNKSLYTCTFTLEKPTTGLQPYRQIFPSWLAS